MKTQAAQTLISAAKDFELSQYNFLAFIKNYSRKFQEFNLYPALSELLEIAAMIEELMDQKFLFDRDVSKKITKTDLIQRLPIYEPLDFSDDEIDKMFDFVKWALPRLKDVITEGKAIFDYVDENLTVDEIGIIESDNFEGYIVVPEVENSSMHIYKWEISSSADEDSIRTLKTELKDTLDLNDFKEMTPERIKLYLLNNYSELSNSVTYYFNTKVDLPFSDTILPIIKRKLIQKLAA